jgi:phosphoribosylaminoimidazolecarboxamide formyltransferase/IMP cyclohydrolase
MRTPVRRALLSVYDKTGLIALAQALHGMHVELLSTGGSAKALREAGLPVTEVAAETGSPEILGGRVKTLHPMIHGGLLAERTEVHLSELARIGGKPIDLVVLNLYPFEAARTAAAGGGRLADVIEMIDIGGPAMLRAAAKNFAWVGVLTDPADYPAVLLEIGAGGLTKPTRVRLARKAFARVADYDNAIADFFAELPDELAPDAAAPPGSPFPARFSLAADRLKLLRYGENPHQGAALYATRPARAGALAAAEAREGKALSFNNFLDLDAALNLALEFTAPACVIVKHNNPCGAATGADLAAAFTAALATDPISAFGGIIAVNRPIDEGFVEALGKLFVECIAAPAISDAARAKLESRKNLRLLISPDFMDRTPGPDLRLLNGTLLLQEPDSIILRDELRPVTARVPSLDELAALNFAFTIAKHVKSNAIVFAAKDRTLAIGAGQMSRLDSVKIAAEKAKIAGLSLAGSAAASDAFFPFADGLIAAADAGATSVIQPGGSVKDEEVIAAADERKMAMVFTGIRHFRH